MRLPIILLILLISFSSTSEAAGGTVIERVKERGHVRCGSVERPGLASTDGHGHWSGLEVDLCRAVADAVLGSPSHIEYHSYQAGQDFDAVRKHEDDLFFLTGSEIACEKLAGKVLIGPPVFLESHAVMVPARSGAQHVHQLAKEGICFETGSSVERSLEAYFERAGQNWLRQPFSEEGEMVDMYEARRCQAMAGEITTLASVARKSGISKLYRILPETLADFPIVAATGTDDGQWSSIVAWTINTLITAERPETKWYPGAAATMPVEAKELGLESGWQVRVLRDLGNYGDIFERNLGKGCRLKIDRGRNAGTELGGVLLGPVME